MGSVIAHVACRSMPQWRAPSALPVAACCLWLETFCECSVSRVSVPVRCGGSPQTFRAMAAPRHRHLQRLVLSVLAMYSVSTSLLFTLQVTNGSASIHSPAERTPGASRAGGQAAAIYRRGKTVKALQAREFREKQNSGRRGSPVEACTNFREGRGLAVFFLRAMALVCRLALELT